MKSVIIETALKSNSFESLSKFLTTLSTPFQVFSFKEFIANNYSLTGVWRFLTMDHLQSPLQSCLRIYNSDKFVNLYQIVTLI